LELETFKDIVGRQIDTIQAYFDACSEVTNGLQMDNMDLTEDQHDEMFGSNEACIYIIDCYKII
jgi:hypothetical protein